MKWQGRRKSTNIDDRRGQSSGSGQGIGGFNPTLLGPIVKLLFSKVGLVIVGLFLVVSLVMEKNPLSLITQLLSGGMPQTESATP